MIPGSFVRSATNFLLSSLRDSSLIRNALDGIKMVRSKLKDKNLYLYVEIRFESCTHTTLTRGYPVFQLQTNLSL
jgi:hypothetical protein